ncbi:MAG TPA: hypothetical protein PK760_01025, partial [Flavobacteriales bacterium]|nr:hypothetical protein [Flavobacteriales bacterium]
MPSRARISIFFTINLFLCSWHLFSGRSDNIVSRSAMVAAIVVDGTLNIDAYKDLTGDKSSINGHYYSEKAPLPALVVVPFWWVAWHSGLVAHDEQGAIRPALIALGGFICGSVPMALIMTMLWLALHALPRPSIIPPAVLSTLPLYGSFLFIFSGSWFGHLSGAALLLLAYHSLLRRSYFMCGFYAGAAVLCDHPLAVFP